MLERKSHFHSALSTLLNTKDILTMQELQPQRENKYGLKRRSGCFRGNKIKDREFAKLELSPIWVRLKLPAEDGKLRFTDCINTQNAFRLIQSIPSKKAEPFKQWLAKVGYERVQEIENPELAQERMKQLYEQKGYSQEWIEKRIRGIAIRQELTDEWKERGIEQKVSTWEVMAGLITNKPLYALITRWLSSFGYFIITVFDEFPHRSLTRF